MLSMFSGGEKDDFWPLSRVISDLKRKYGKADLMGEDGPLKVYGIEDNGVNFVVAVMQTAAGSGKITELGLLARFTGFPVEARTVETINRKLNISVASMEGADLFLMAGLQVTGAYDKSQFYMILDAWKRDLVVTLQGINGDQASMTHGLPIAKLEAAYSFATNIAQRKGDNATTQIDRFSQFFGGEGASKEFCDLCHGRGKRGFLSRTCDDCDGSGFVEFGGR